MKFKKTKLTFNCKQTKGVQNENMLEMSIVNSRKHSKSCYFRIEKSQRTSLARKMNPEKLIIKEEEINEKIQQNQNKAI